MTIYSEIWWYMDSIIVAEAVELRQSVTMGACCSGATNSGQQKSLPEHEKLNNVDEEADKMVNGRQGEVAASCTETTDTRKPTDGEAGVAAVNHTPVTDDAQKSSAAVSSSDVQLDTTELERAEAEPAPERVAACAEEHPTKATPQEDEAKTDVAVASEDRSTLETSPAVEATSTLVGGTQTELAASVGDGATQETNVDVVGQMVEPAKTDAVVTPSDEQQTVSSEQAPAETIAENVEEEHQEKVADVEVRVAETSSATVATDDVGRQTQVCVCVCVCNSMQFYTTLCNYTYICAVVKSNLYSVKTLILCKLLNYEIHVFLLSHSH